MLSGPLAALVHELGVFQTHSGVKGVDGLESLLIGSNLRFLAATAEQQRCDGVHHAGGTCSLEEKRHQRVAVERDSSLRRRAADPSAARPHRDHRADPAADAVADRELPERQTEDRL